MYLKELSYQIKSFDNFKKEVEKYPYFYFLTKEDLAILKKLNHYAPVDFHYERYNPKFRNYYKVLIKVINFHKNYNLHVPLFLINLLKKNS